MDPYSCLLMMTFCTPLGPHWKHFSRTVILHFFATKQEIPFHSLGLLSQMLSRTWTLPIILYNSITEHMVNPITEKMVVGCGISFDVGSLAFVHLKEKEVPI